MNRLIDDKEGLCIKPKKKKGYHAVPDPTGKLVMIPKSIHADELFDEQAKADKDLLAFADSCVKLARVAVIGTTDDNPKRILGCRLVHTDKLTPAVMRRAARLSIQSGWKNVTLVADEELSKVSRDAAIQTFDIGLMKLNILIAS